VWEPHPSVLVRPPVGEEPEPAASLASGGGGGEGGGSVRCQGQEGGGLV
jgi:hypothetical protein